MVLTWTWLFYDINIWWHKWLTMIKFRLAAWVIMSLPNFHSLIHLTHTHTHMVTSYTTCRHPSPIPHSISPPLPKKREWKFAIWYLGYNTKCVPKILLYLAKSNEWGWMYSDHSQTGPVATEQLCKHPDEHSAQFFVLNKLQIRSGENRFGNYDTFSDNQNLFQFISIQNEHIIVIHLQSWEI